ncbi:MAG: universal stress protein [Acidimicrobiales bacterium]
MNASISELPDAQFRHVLVPLDGSELSLAAIPTARVLAERFDAELHTISVAEAGGGDADRLLAFGSIALGVDVGDARAVVVTGDPAEGIVQRAEELGACLVCLSTHGRGRLSGAFVGSVARSVLRLSRDAVVAVGPLADRPGWSPSPNWPPPLSVRRIVVCVDGSANSEEVLPVASAWARALGMSMTIVTVIEDAPAPLRPDRGAGQYGAGRDVDAYVEDLVKQWQATAPNVNGEVIKDPISVASGLRTYLDQKPAGLVAVTTHARTGLRRLLLGATAASIVHASVAPCLVVPLRV